MAVFETWLKSDLKKPLTVKPLTGNLFSADNHGNLIGVEVMDGGSPAELSGGVTGYVIRADGATLPISGTREENKASIVLPASAYAVIGHISIVIKVGGTTVGACTSYVYQTTTDTIVDPGQVMPSIADLLAQIEAAVATIPASWAGLMADIAPTYSDTAVYPVGSYVYYSGDLYRCTTAITTAESWTAGHWTKAVLGNDVTDLKSAISNIPFHGIDFTVNANSEHSSTKDQIPVYVKAGEKFVILCDQGIHGVYAYYADGTNETVQEKGIASKEIIAFGKYLNNATESNVRCRLIVVTNPYGVDILENLDYANLLKKLTLGKNIVGSEPGVYYPVYIPAGTTFTMSTSDGSTIQSDLRLHMYNANKVELSDWWTFRSGTSERTVTQTVSLGTAYYMKWDKQPPVPLQVEVGAKTTYEPYFGNTKYLYEANNSILEQLDQISNKVVNKNLIGMDSSLFYPVDIPVGTVLTMSTADGTALGQNGLNLEGYDADKNQVDSWNFNPGMSKRTITWAKNDAYYLKWSYTPIKNVQVELGSEATDYQKYIVDVSNEFIIDELLRGNSATTDLVVQNTFVSDYTEHDYMSAVSKYNALVLESSGDNEQFLFFTDPHLAVQTGGGEGMLDITYDFINHLNAVYNASPVSFFVDGGDWLGNSDTPGVAANKLTFIDGFMRKKIKDYYPLNGNHDTNYQGKATPESETYTGKISNAILIKLRNVFRCANRMYYHFSGATSSWYCFDTGTENEQIGTYQNAQLSWFATSLLSDSSEHIVIAAHILIYGHSIQEIQPLTDELLKIAEAFNARQTISVDGQSYDYSTKTGKVSFCITGHLHDDWNGTVHNIPCIITTNATSGSKLTFDLCLADWESKTLYLQRVGNGSDRTITIL